MADSICHSTAALVLFFKRPQPGTGKQRLAVDIGEATAYEVAKRLLACALEDMALWSGPLVFAVAAAADRDWVVQEVMPSFKRQSPDILLQGAGNLGERINRIDQALRARGHRDIIFIGSDAPVLTAAVYSEASKRLETSDVVLAGSDDGGVTIMASRHPWPDISHLPWSTDQLGTALAGVCERQGLTVDVFDGGYDIDYLPDLMRLYADLKDDIRPARQALMTYLSACLADRVRRTEM